MPDAADNDVIVLRLDGPRVRGANVTADVIGHRPSSAHIDRTNYGKHVLRHNLAGWAIATERIRDLIQALLGRRPRRLILLECAHLCCSAEFRLWPILLQK